MNRQLNRIALTGALAATALVTAIDAQPAAAADRTVTTTTDVVNAGDGLLSLREAVTASNFGDRIIIPAGTYTLQCPSGPENANASGDLDIFRGITMSGPTTGTATITINPACNERVIQVSMANVSPMLIENLTITGGREAADFAHGGGIRIAGTPTTTFDNTIVTDNVAGPKGNGGGIYSLGPLVVRNGSVVSNNHAGDAASGPTVAKGGDGGGIAVNGTTASLTITGSTVSNNTSGSGNGSGFGSRAGSGGGVYVETRHALDITGSTIDGNSLGAGGNGAIGDNATGGGLAARSATGTVTAVAANISASTISNNVGGSGLIGGGGGAWIEHTKVSISTTQVLSNSTAQAKGGGAAGPGGGIAVSMSSRPFDVDIDLIGNTIRGNTIATPESGFVVRGGDGGGLYVQANGGTVDLTNNDFDGNVAGDSTGGVPGHGGNVHIDLRASSSDPADPPPPAINVTGGQIRNGRSGGGPAGTSTGNGGGAYIVAGSKQSGGTVVINGVSVTGNTTGTTTASGAGGGIYANIGSTGAVFTSGKITVTGATVTGNSTGDAATASNGGSGGPGGGLFLEARGIATGTTVEIVNSTIGTNAAGDGAVGTTALGGLGGAGGGAFVRATSLVVDGSTFTKNASGSGAMGQTTGGRGGHGGGLGVEATEPGASVTVTGTTFDQNTTGNGGDGSATGGVGGSGGGARINSVGNISITNPIVTMNRTGNAGAGATTGAVGGDGGGLALVTTGASAAVTVSGGTIADNTAGNGADGGTGQAGLGGDGGGLYVEVSEGATSLDAVRIERNHAGDGAPATGAAGSKGGFGGDGGGVYIRDLDNSGRVSIIGSTVAANTAGDAGASTNDTAGIAGDGGGLFVDVGNIPTPGNPGFGTGTVSIERTTISGNKAGAGATGTTTTGGGNGGGAFLRSGDGPGNDVDIIRSTIDGNAGGDAATPTSRRGDGGGLYIDPGASIASLDQVTLTSNDGLNGVAVLTRATRTLFRGTVIGDKSNKQLDSCNAIGVTITSSGYNVEASEGGFSCGFGLPTDLNAASTDLGALGDNGGPTLTRLPIADGALVDKIPCGATVDQRGSAAPSGDSCDIGAVETGVGTFTIADLTVSEDVGTANVIVTRTSGADPVAVRATTVDGRARGTLDFTPTTATLTWGAGESGPRTFSVPILRDEFDESDESFTVTAAGETATITITDPVVPPAPVDLIVPTDPSRFVDTRATGTTLDGVAQAEGKRAADSEYKVKIAGRGNVPADAIGVVMNVTAVGADGTGFATVHPCLTPRPTASSLNYTSGVNLGNEIIASLDSAGQACFYTSAGIHLTVDVVGYVPQGSAFVSISPSRVLETRDLQTIDRQAEGGGKTAPGSTTRVTIGGRAGVPNGAGTVVVNLTAVGATSNGFVTVHPCAAEAPTAASLNYTSGVNRGNELVAQLNDSGELCIFTSSSIHLTVDLVGYIPTGTSLTSVPPARLIDTRDTTKRAAGSQLTLGVANRAGVPTGAKAVVVNVTAVQPEAVGFVTVHPCLPTPPNASSLNHVANVNGGNEILARLSATGELCLFTSGTTNLTVDVVAYLT